MLQKLNPNCGRPTGVDLLTSLIWLTLGAFAIGTEGFMIAGLLPALARDLSVGVPAAGHLVTAFSLAYAIGAPVMAVLTARLERRRLLAVAMGGFALANLLAALAPGYAGLLAARLLLALYMLAVLASSVLTVAGTFTVYTYFGVFLASVAGLGPKGTARALLGFGLARAVGTRLGGSAADRLGARPTVILGGGLVLLGVPCPLARREFSRRRGRCRSCCRPSCSGGLASWGLITAQQARLVALAPALAPVSLSLNSSAIYLGSATGAAVGAIVIADGVMGRLGWVAAGFSLAALLPVLATRGQSQRLRRADGKRGAQCRPSHS